MRAIRAVARPVPPFTWTDRNLRWRVEIDQRIIDEISETGAETAVLLGALRKSEGEPLAFVVRERIAVVSNDFGELAPASLAQLEMTIPARAADRQTVGLVCPSRSALRHLVTSLSRRTNLVPEQVLVLRATDSGLVQGLIWEPAETNISSLELEFQLQMSAEPPEPLANPIAKVPAAPPAEAVLQSPAHRPVPTVRVEIPQWVWAAGLAVMLAIGGAIVWRLRPASPAPQQTQASTVVIPAAANRLGMQIRRSDNAWEVQWDAARVAALGAQSGVLQVIDGDGRVDIPLNAVQLAQGRVVYVPKSGDLEMVLSASSASGMVQDSVRVIGSPIGRPVDSGSRARALTPPASSVPESAFTRETATQPVRAFQPPSPSPAAESAMPKPDLTPAMTAQVQAPPPQPITLRIETAPVPQQAAPPAAQVAAPVQQQPASQAPLQQTPTQQPATPAVSRVLSQPIVLSKVAPVVPAHLKSVMPRDASVDVQLRVGTDGRVVAASAPQTSGVMAHLTRLAIDSAKRWRFEPAKLNGQPVESDHKVTFRFGR
jgi:protein TonB